MTATVQAATASVIEECTTAECGSVESLATTGEECFEHRVAAHLDLHEIGERCS